MDHAPEHVADLEMCLIPGIVKDEMGWDDLHFTHVWFWCQRVCLRLSGGSLIWVVHVPRDRGDGRPSCMGGLFSIIIVSDKLVSCGGVAPHILH